MRTCALLLVVLLVVLLVAFSAAADDGAFACQVIRPAGDPGDAVVEGHARSAKRRAIGAHPIEIDVMEVYGPYLLREAGSASAARAFIQHQVDATNTALSDSGLGHIRLRLRHARFSNDYDSFPAQTAPGPEIQLDRQYYGADLLGFAVGQTPFGIVGAACRPPTYNATCGVHWLHAGNFAIYPLAYVHELGHNLGADHDAPNAQPRDTDAHPFARALCVPGLWRTVMSYDKPCHAPPVMLFSNPRKTLGGLATGITEEADNARAIAISAPLVRDYYPATTNSGPRCEFRIAFDDTAIPAAGASRTVIAERTRGDCAPAITPLEEWLRVEVAPGSTPERTVATVTILPHTRPASRKGFFVVGEQPVAVTQSSVTSCLLPNGSFDRDLNGWAIRAGREHAGTIAWSPLDATGNPGSGSMAVTLGAGRGQVFVDRCVAIEPADRHLLRSSIYIPPGQTAGLDDHPAFMMVTLFPTSDCSGPDPYSSGDSIKNIAGAWLPMESEIITRQPGHPDARSIRISLSVFVSSAAPFTTHFDEVYLCKTTGE